MHVFKLFYNKIEKRVVFFQKSCFDQAQIGWSEGHVKHMVKIGIIGVGNIGGALAHSLLGEPGVALYLYDIKSAMARGKAKDLRQAAAIAGHGHTRIFVPERMSDLKECDVVVVIAGLARQPGMDRTALMQSNSAIIQDVAQSLRGTEAVVLVVTNPVDAMTTLMTRLLDAPRGQVVGMAGILDEGRFCAAIAKILSIEPGDVTGCVVGAHNDSMVPLVSSIRWGGLPLSADQVDRLIIGGVIEQTRRGGADIVRLLGQGSAYYGPAEAAKVMVRAIIRDENRLLRCSVMLHGEYGGVKDLCCGTPVILGRQGARHILEYPLSPEEFIMLRLSIDTLRNELATMHQKDASA
jgi:malate dehydrogenase